jgi:hypothetical protein
MTHCVELHNKYVPCLTSRNRVFLKQLTGVQLVQKYPAFCWTLWFTTVLMRSLHPPHHTLNQKNPATKTSFYFIRSHFNIIFPSSIVLVLYISYVIRTNTIRLSEVWQSIWVNVLQLNTIFPGWCRKKYPEIGHVRNLLPTYAAQSA